jgi:hypothetical protein
MKLLEKETDYDGSKICLLSSQLFLIAAIYHIYYTKNYIVATGIILVYLTSCLYHGTGKGRKLDMCSNISMMILFSIVLYKNNNTLPLVFCFMSVIGYCYNKKINDKNRQYYYHCLFVHIPVVIGFFTIK